MQAASESLFLHCCNILTLSFLNIISLTINNRSTSAIQRAAKGAPPLLPPSPPPPPSSTRQTADIPWGKRKEANSQCLAFRSERLPVVMPEATCSERLPMLMLEAIRLELQTKKKTQKTQKKKKGTSLLAMLSTWWMR